MTAAHSDEDILAVAKLVDPPAFSDRYEPVLPSRHEKWLTNKNRRIRAAIAKADRILELVAAPAGDTVTVPREPTADMEAAGAGHLTDDNRSHEAACEHARIVYRAMIAAAPTTPAGKVGE